MGGKSMPTISDRTGSKRACALLSLAPVIALTAACKPPPTDADMLRDVPEAAMRFASDPLPSPDTTGAMWAMSARTERRIIYGVPSAPALLALDCELSGEPALQITRLSPADEGAGAMLALVGNGHIGRIKVDATKVGGPLFWVGSAPAQEEVWEPLTGPRESFATVPGGGTVAINPSALPGEMIAACRAGNILEPDAPQQESAPEDASPLP